ncbi:4'-phosphopantetheinyl transferase superfamily protein [Kitasatospora nipponensis]|uniref:4'-phosphopantetheinyl transferase superfamily protein n=1 Tax=Kitasatospora nipponensis TaxID=258049 RepID=A0ABN1VR89_9ACTN
MIEWILPAGVAVAQAFQDEEPAAGGTGSALFPAEARLVARAVPGRQREFATGRACARRALAELGHPPRALLPDRRGAPQWPAGVVGSITHCAGYRAAAVARSDRLAALGIDAEPNGVLKEGILEAVSLPGERAMVAALAARSAVVRWDRLLFSAKESVFKAWYTLTGRELDFPEAQVAIEPSARTFTARLLVPGPVVDGRRLDGFEGRWLAAEGLLVTAVAVPSGA